MTFFSKVRYSGNCDPSFYTAPEPVTEAALRMNSQLDASLAAVPQINMPTSFSDQQSVDRALQDQIINRYKRFAKMINNS